MDLGQRYVSLAFCTLYSRHLFLRPASAYSSCSGARCLTLRVRTAPASQMTFERGTLSSRQNAMSTKRRDCDVIKAWAGQSLRIRHRAAGMSTLAAAPASCCLSAKRELGEQPRISRVRRAGDADRGVKLFGLPRYNGASQPPRSIN